jgi:hypothetical protein
MKAATFNALTTVETPAAALLLAEGTNFLFNESQISGTNKEALRGNQQNKTALRHKITYYRRTADDALSLAGQDSIGYVRVLDILESADTGAESKTATRPGVNRVVTRDDDDRLRYKTGDWS